MNNEQLFDRLHEANAYRRQQERGRRRNRSAWWITAGGAAAAVGLILLIPTGSHVQAQALPDGCYCNMGCTADELMTVIHENIAHIQQYSDV